MTDESPIEMMRACAERAIEHGAQHHTSGAREALDKAAGWAIVAIAEDLHSIAFAIDQIDEHGIEVYQRDSDGHRRFI